MSGGRRQAQGFSVHLASAKPFLALGTTCTKPPPSHRKRCPCCASHAREPTPRSPLWSTVTRGGDGQGPTWKGGCFTAFQPPQEPEMFPARQEVGCHPQQNQGETDSSGPAKVGTALPTAANSWRNRPKRATTKPNPIKANLVCTHASRVRSAAKRTRGLAFLSDS